MKTSKMFPGRLGLLQRVLPAYRAPLFDTLAQACQGGLGVFAGQPKPKEGITATTDLQAARLTLTRNFHLGDPSSAFYLCWQRGLMQWLKRWNPDAMIVEANPRYLSTVQAIRWMHARGRPVLGWGLGAPPLTGPLAGLRYRARSWLLHRLDGVIAYSQRGAAEYLSLGLPAERIFVAPNAVAPRPNTPPPERPSTFQERPTVLFVGRLQARKRLDNLLQACADLPAELQPRLWIIGDGPARDALQSLAEHLYPYTEFLGAKHGKELEPFFQKADLFVLPGTGGLAVQQAMAYGLPVIVARGDGTQEDLVRPENGWLVPPDNPTALTAALHSALTNPARLRDMGAQSYRLVVEEINIEAMVDVFIKALNFAMMHRAP